MVGQNLIFKGLLFITLLSPFSANAAAPSAPILDVAVNEQIVSASWSNVSDASGYNLHYAPKPYAGVETIVSLNMGTQTSISVQLPIGSSFYVALTAYNSEGESGYSNIASFTINSQVLGYSYEEVWSHTTDLNVPESVLYDPIAGIAYVSNIGGSPSGEDGNGFISTLNINGDLVKANAFPNVTLNAPKGMALYDNKLYVADITQLVEIDLITGKTTRFAPFGAVFLNDVAADLNGNIYVSDSDIKNSVIYRLSNGSISIWFDDSYSMSSPNGLTVSGRNLLVGSSANGNILSINIDNLETVTIAQSDVSVDGLLLDGRGNYFLSDWDGHIYWISSSGMKMLLYTGMSNVADFEYISDSGLILLPTFFGDSVFAIRVTPIY